MSLKEQLKELKAKKRVELETLHYTYVRTKRDVNRTLSPDRLVRKHLGATLGVSALLGMLLAPRPGPRTTKAKVERPAGGGFMHTLFAQIGKMFGKKDDPEKMRLEALKAFNQGKLPKVRGLWGMLLPIILGRLDLTRLISEITRSAMSKMQSRRHHHNGNGHSPDMSVADAGTVKPDSYHDFQ